MGNLVRLSLSNPTCLIRLTASITVCPITTYVMDTPLFRLPIEPSSENGLRSSSQIMVDKISTLKVERVHQKIGCLHAKQIVELNKALKRWLDIA